jgi:23S rRNA pseudouridine2605 synthase
MLTDPKYGIKRTYEVLIRGTLDRAETEKILKGVDIGRQEMTRPTRLRVLDKKADSTLVEITLKEGKNREIRRLFEQLGKPVRRLLRTKYGPFKLGNIKPGKWVEIEELPHKL